jgi:uncharacterized membrane protein YkoI
MKKMIFLLACCLTVCFAHAQKLKIGDVPSPVKDSFTKRFPNAKDVSWSKENATEFEAEFKTNDREQSANFDQTGKWVETETEIKTKDLPAAVQAALAKEFSGYKVEEAELNESSNSTLYEVEIEKGKSAYEVQFSADGKVIKKEEKKEKDKDKDKD